MTNPHPAGPAGPAGDGAVLRPRRTRRVVGLVATWLLGPLVLPFTVVATGVAGRVGGWAWTALFLAPLVALTWRLTRGLRGRRAIRIIAVAVSALLATALVAGAAPGYDRLEQAADGLPVPTDAVLLRVDGEGSTWCLKQCPKLIYHYAVPDAAAAEAAMRRDLTADGWERSWRGNFRVGVTSEDALPRAEHLPPLVDPPAGWELLVVSMGGPR